MWPRSNNGTKERSICSLDFVTGELVRWRATSSCKVNSEVNDEEKWRTTVERRMGTECDWAQAGLLSVSAGHPSAS